MIIPRPRPSLVIAACVSLTIAIWAQAPADAIGVKLSAEALERIDHAVASVAVFD